MLFQRVCKLVVGKPNQEELVFDQSFRITFEIKKSITSASKLSKIEIYNLSRDTRDRLRDIISRNADLAVQGQAQLIAYLYAGYEENTGLELLYSANITNIYSRREPPDVITTVTCADNAVVFKNTFVAESHSEGVSTKEIAESLASKLGMTIDDSSNVPTHINLAHGYSFVGSAKVGVNKLMKQIKCNWTTENGKIRIHPIGGYTNDSIVVISSDSGMIKSPERIESQGTDSENGKIKHGWRVTSLLEPKLLPGRRVKIESEAVNGIYIVDSVEHKGDTATGDWQSVIETKEKQE